MTTVRKPPFLKPEMDTFDKDWRRVIRCVEVLTEMGNVQSLTPVGKLYGCSVFVDETMKMGEDGAADIRIVTGKETKTITVREKIGENQ